MKGLCRRVARRDQSMDKKKKKKPRKSWGQDNINAQILDFCLILPLSSSFIYLHKHFQRILFLLANNNACGWGYTTAPRSWSHSHIHNNCKTCIFTKSLDMLQSIYVGFHCPSPNHAPKKNNFVVGYEKGWICLWNVFGCCLIILIII